MALKFVLPYLLTFLFYIGIALSAPPTRLRGVFSENTDDTEITRQMEKVDEKAPFRNGGYEYETLQNKAVLDDILNNVFSIPLDEVKTHQLTFKDGTVFLGNSPASTLDKTGKVTSYMYVMDREGNFFLYPEKRGVFHHSSISQGERVAAAGMIRIQNGSILWIDGESGHYRTPEYHFAQALRSLERQGINLGGIEVGYFSIDKTKRKVTTLTRSEANVIRNLGPFKNCTSLIRRIFRGSGPRFGP